MMTIQPKIELAQKRPSSINIAGHGTGNTVVLEAEAVFIFRTSLEAADGVAQNIAAVAMLFTICIVHSRGDCIS